MCKLDFARRSYWTALVVVLGLSWSGCTVDFSRQGDVPDANVPGCGNSILELGEVCDGTDFGGQDCQSAVGHSMGSLACTATCGLDVSGCHDCGNGVLNDDETCDDQNSDAGDGCMGCQVETGWTCAGSPSVCATICGDGLVLGVEACDDGNTENGDGCTGGCEGEAGWVCTGEPSECAETCGNGVQDPGEACDDGNLSYEDGCSPSCVVEMGYDCTGWPSVCTPVCGDGVVLPGEACDDGNTATGDGCLDNCTVETGWDCDFTAEPPQGCVPICGDGLLVGGEECDDGDAFSNDGCSNSCQVEAYSACDGEPSQCVCVVYVDRDVVTGNDGQTWASAYQRLDDALPQAYSRRPCEVWVAEGTYYTYRFSPTDSISLYDDSEIYGGFDGTETARDQRDWLAHPTTISGEQESAPSNRVRQIFRANGDTDVIIDGFTISRAWAQNDRGGGIEIENNSIVTLQRVVFSANEAERGGAIYMTGGSQVTVRDATFLSNVAEDDGGAIYADNWGALTLEGCLLQGNQAGQTGGGIYAQDPTIDVSNCRFHSNQAVEYGGAILYRGNQLTVSGTVFWGNDAGQGGGALSFYQNSNNNDVINCTFYENTTSGGGGRAIRAFDSDVDVVNSILWGAATGQIYETMGGDINLDYCNINVSVAGQGNINQTPVFVDPTSGDLRLDAGSPGIDAAWGSTAPIADIDGYLREDDPATTNTGGGTPDYVDMGAHEFQPLPP